MQKIKEAFKNVAAGKFLPVYLLMGEEIYLKEQFLHTLCANYLEGENPTSGARKIEGNEPSLKEVLEDLKRPNLFSGGKKIAVIKHPPYLESAATTGASTPGNNKGKGPGEEETMISSFWERESAKVIPESILILWASNVDKRKRLYRYLDKVGAVINCAPLKGEELKKWAAKEMGKYGKKITSEAIDKLLLATEGNMLRISREIEKMACYLESGEQEVTAPIVDLLVHSETRGNIFHLVDALAERKPSLAYRQLYDLFTMKEPPVKILYMIVRHFRLLISASSYLQKGRNSKELSKLLQVQPFVANKLHSQAKGYDLKELENIYFMLQRTDLDIKTGRVDPYQGLELLLGRIQAVAKEAHK